MTFAISLVVPMVAAVALFAFRRARPRIAADSRGIALQTIIIIVVLLGIAGAVAGVLLSRSTDEIGRLDSGGEFRSHCASAGGTPVPATGTATSCTIPNTSSNVTCQQYTAQVPGNAAWAAGPPITCTITP